MYLISALWCPPAIAEHGAHLGHLCSSSPLCHLVRTLPSTPPDPESLILRPHLLSLTSSPKSWELVLNSGCHVLNSSCSLVSSLNLPYLFPLHSHVNAHVIRFLPSVHRVVSVQFSFLPVFPHSDLKYTWSCSRGDLFIRLIQRQN